MDENGRIVIYFNIFLLFSSIGCIEESANIISMLSFLESAIFYHESYETSKHKDHYEYGWRTTTKRAACGRYSLKMHDNNNIPFLATRTARSDTGRIDNWFLANKYNWVIFFMGYVFVIFCMLVWDFLLIVFPHVFFRMYENSMRVNVAWLLKFSRCSLDIQTVKIPIKTPRKLFFTISRFVSPTLGLLRN